MTLPVSSGRIVANGNGVTTSWPYNFIIPDATYAVVTITNIATGVSTTLLSSQYSISGINNPAGGTVTYPLIGSPLAAGNTLTIQRIVPYSQSTDLTNQDGFYAAVIENELDFLTMQIQQLSDAVGRALVADAFGAGTIDADGNRIINLANGTGAQDAATYGQLTSAVIAAGNVPAPGAGNIGKWLQALTATTWGWQTISVLIANIADAGVFGKTLLAETSAADARTDLSVYSQAESNSYFSNAARRQALLSASVDSAGLANWLPATATGLTVTTQFVTNFDVTYAGGANGQTGDINTGGRISGNVTWTGLANNTTNYLYLELQINGTLLPKSSTLAPVYSMGFTGAVTNDQWTFCLPGMYGGVGNGASFDTSARPRIYVGEAVTTAGNVTATVAYQYLSYYEYTDTGNLPLTAVTLNHNLGLTTGVRMELYVVCATAEAGYSIGDIVSQITNFDGAAVQSPAMWLTRNQCGFRIPGTWRIPNKTTGVSVPLTVANWRYRVRVRREW